MACLRWQNLALCATPNTSYIPWGGRAGRATCLINMLLNMQEQKRSRFFFFFSAPCVCPSRPTLSRRPRLLLVLHETMLHDGLQAVDNGLSGGSSSGLVNEHRDDKFDKVIRVGVMANTLDLTLDSARE
jgi:hypothetical protein